MSCAMLATLPEPADALISSPSRESADNWALGLEEANSETVRWKFSGWFFSPNPIPIA